MSNIAELLAVANNAANSSVSEDGLKIGKGMIPALNGVVTVITLAENNTEERIDLPLVDGDLRLKPVYFDPQTGERTPIQQGQSYNWLCQNIWQNVYNEEAIKTRRLTAKWLRQIYDKYMEGKVYIESYCGLLYLERPKKAVKLSSLGEYNFCNTYKNFEC